MSKTTQAKQRAVARYNAKNYTRIALRLRNQDADELKGILNGRSINGFVTDAIREKIEREKSQGGT